MDVLLVHNTRFLLGARSSSRYYTATKLILQLDCCRSTCSHCHPAPYSTCAALLHYLLYNRPEVFAIDLRYLPFINTKPANLRRTLRVDSGSSPFALRGPRLRALERFVLTLHVFRVRAMFQFQCSACPPQTQLGFISGFDLSVLLASV